MGGPELRERMRMGVASALRRVGSLPRVTGVSLVALLCASALAPVVAAVVAGQSVALAGAGVVGSIGANALTDLVKGVADRLRGQGAEIDQAAAEAELAIVLERALADGGELASVLLEAAAALLQGLDAVGVLVEAAAARDGELAVAATEGFAELGRQFSAFGFVVDDVHRAVWEIRAALRREEVRSRAERERNRERDLVLLRLLEAAERGGLKAPLAGLETGSAVWRGCPYLGLRPFREGDAQVFYGRAELADKVVQRLGERLGSGGILLIVGASGAGKSSLLEAGVLPRLAGGALGPGSARWPRRVMTPTASPLRELALKVADVGGLDPVWAYRALSEAPGEMPLLVSQAVRSATGSGSGRDSLSVAADVAPRLVLIVDQFEELFTLGDAGSHQAEQEAFATALHAAATVPVGAPGVPAALVLAALRGDFVDRAMAYPPLAAAVEEGPLAMTHMSEAELRQAINGPAAEAGLTVETDLADAVLAELRGAGADGGLGSGVLPLMSQAMADTWEHRESDRLTVRAYRRAGGAADAVNRGAQAAYESLTSQQRDAARLVFTRLTIITAEGQFERRRCSRADLHAAPTGGITTDAIDAVIDVFAARRLLVIGDDSIEISHDALLRAWTQVRQWLGEDQIDRALCSQVVTDAKTWDTSHQDPAYLYQPSRLPAIAAAVNRWESQPTRFGPLPPYATEFLQAAQRAAARAAWRWRAFIASLLLLTTAASIAAVIAVNNAASATRQHAIALSRQLAAESLVIDHAHPVTARRLAYAAWRVFPTAQALSAVETVLTEQQRLSILPADPASVSGVAFSPDGHLLASAGIDGTVRLWNPDTGQPIGAPIPADTAPGARGGVLGVAFSPDGHLLATGDGDGTVRLWNPATGRPIGQPLPASSRGGVNGVAFSPDGHLLASAGADGTVRLWNPDTGQRVGRPIPADTANAFGNGDGVRAVAFSPDGHLLASADTDGTVRLWNPATGQRASQPLHASATDSVLGVAFSPDGHLLASADGDGTVRLWNPATGQRVGQPLRTGSLATGGSFGVAFSPDSRLLASADSDGTVRLWNPATGQPTGSPIAADTTAGNHSGESGVAFSPDGRLLAGAGFDGTVRLWDPITGRPIGAVLHADHTAAGDASVHDVAFSPDGRLLATADRDGTLRLWDPVTGAPLHTVHIGGVLGVSSVAFSPDGRLLATADSDGTIRLWNPIAGKPVSAPLTATQLGPVNAVAFSPDGHLLASAADDGTLRLWNPATGQLIGIPFRARRGPPMLTVVVSPEGRFLASVDGGGTVRMSNLVTGRTVSTGLHDANTDAVAFSPGSQLLAVADSRGWLRLWSLTTGHLTGPAIHVRSNGVQGLAFSPNGRILATADGDGTVRLWNPATGKPIGIPLPSNTGNGAGVNEVTFSPDGQLIATADGDGTVWVWRVSPFAHPATALCATVGLPSKDEWNRYAHGEPRLRDCACLSGC